MPVRTCCGLLGVWLVAVSWASPAATLHGAGGGRPQSSERARAQALEREAVERIEALRRESEALGAREDSLLGEIRRLETERQRAAAQVAELDRELARIEQVLEETAEQITDLGSAIEEQRPLVAARLVETYKLGQARYARLLLNVDDLRSLGRTYRMVTELARLDRRRIAEYESTLTALESTVAALEEEREEQRRLQASARQARRRVDDTIAQHGALMQRIAERRELNDQFTAELHRSRQLLQATLAALAGNAPAAPVPSALPIGPFRGALEWPATGVVTRAASEPGPEANTVIVRDGIEIAAPQGLGVRAIHQGRVAFADRFTGFGNLVIVDHGDDDLSVYGYLSVIAARRGALVDRGQILGSVGRSPQGDPALYFELRIDGSPVDPLEWLKEQNEP